MLRHSICRSNRLISFHFELILSHFFAAKAFHNKFFSANYILPNHKNFHKKKPSTKLPHYTHHKMYTLTIRGNNKNFGWNSALFFFSCFRDSKQKKTVEISIVPNDPSLFIYSVGGIETAKNSNAINVICKTPTK